MSDQPQHPQDGQEEDLLDQIMNKSPAYNHPEETDQPEPAADAPPAPENKAPSDDEKRKRRSSVYVYLLILFGAAFFMLLLAYFVQQRSSETTISDLRDSMNLSRTELMEQIETLEGESAALQEERDALEAQLAELQRQMEELEVDSFWREKDLFSQLVSWQVFWSLEQSFCDKDYEACAQFFRDVHGSNFYATPAEAAERAEEIYNHLLEQGFLTEDVPLPIVYTAE